MRNRPVIYYILGFLAGMLLLSESTAGVIIAILITAACAVNDWS